MSQKRQTPKVSVIIPTYRRSVELQRAVTSVLLQGFADYEIIVVDDNPPETEARIKNEEYLGRLDPRIVHLKNSRSLGGAEARNVGIRASQAQYVAFLDDDDEWLPSKLQKQVDMLDALDSEVACVDTGFSL